MSRELVQKAKNGDTKAINELIDNHKELAYSIALKYLENKNDAEDVVQNSFIIVLKSLKRFRNESKFSTWLYKIVYYECLRELKKKNKKIQYVPQFLGLTQDNEAYEEISIEPLLKKLNPNEYTVITLFYLKEKNIEEITKITAFSKTNIKVLLHRGRNKMKQSIKTQQKTK